MRGEPVATLIPSIGSCVSRMTGGERRLAERLEAKLDGDYLLWYDVPMGPKNANPDFCVMHPRQILHTATLVSTDLLTADGQALVIIQQSTLSDEAFAIADYWPAPTKKVLSGAAWR